MLRFGRTLEQDVRDAFAEISEITSVVNVRGDEGSVEVEYTTGSGEVFYADDVLLKYGISKRPA